MNTVFVVHCIDTEGPLHEPLSDTFKRLNSIFNIVIEPTLDNLKKLQNNEIDLGGLESSVQKVVNPKLLDYLDTWDKIDEMLDEILSENFRGKFPDSNNNGWIFNWHCLDHVYYNINPRRRDIGFHNIFDHYRKKLHDTKSFQDGINFHFHPTHPFKNDASLCATHWFASSNHLFEIIARRIIDRNWFPCVNRPGFHVNRPDSHWFLEQYIPFDYSNQATILDTDYDQNQLDIADGRFGDWRRAPKTWVPYHPAHDDYQEVGNCRRWIARCLNIGTRTRLLNKEEIIKAFDESREGNSAILAFTNHDFRDIREDISNTYNMIKEVSKEYDDVNIEYADGLTAFRKAMNLKNQSPCEFDLSIDKVGDKAHVLKIKTNVPTFGSQPFFCYKTKTGSYHHDNLDFHKPFHEWSYTFDEITTPINALEKIGVATNNSYGVTTTAVINTKNDEIKHNLLNNHL